MKETLQKNNLNFVKDVPMIHVHFIITEVTVSEGKKIKGGITFILPLGVYKSCESRAGRTKH